MKLAIICRPFSFHGGVETATAGLLAELVRRGYTIDLLSTGRQPDVPGARVRRLATPRHPSLLRFLSFALAARLAIRGGAYDVVQSHERCLLQDVYRAGEGTHLGYLRAMARPGARRTPFHAAVCAVERRIFRLRSARHIAAISRRDQREIERLFGTPPERVSLVYNGVDLARFHPDNRERFRSAIRSALGLSERDWVVLFVGSGFERKGLGALVAGLGRMGRRDWRLVVAGKGNVEVYRRQAAALGIEPRIAWVGARPDVDRLYAMADVVALPALYEPFGNVHLEALASGLPVLTSARAGGAEVVRHGEAGWIVADPTASLVAEGLEALREPQPGRAAAARKSAEPYTYAAQADSFARIYQTLRG